MSKDKRFTTVGKHIKRGGTFLNINFESETDAKLCCELLNQMDRDHDRYIDEIDEICKWHEKHYGKSILAERLEFKSDCEKENEQLKQENERYKRLSEIRNEQINNRILTIREFIDNCSNEDVKNALQDLFYSEVWIR